MPELPEVETVRRCLDRSVLCRTITRVDARRIAMRRPLDPEKLAAGLSNQTIGAVRRRGKYLLLDAGTGSLLVHLGMSGNLLLCPASATRPPHTHLSMLLDNGTELRLIDPRRFGFAEFLTEGQEARDSSLRRLGVEPLSGNLEKNLPPLIRNRTAPIKNLLLDQTLVAGIGNIYAVESLWRSGIHPRRRGSSISVKRLQRLAQAIQSVLSDAIDQGGTTLKDFASPNGEQGYFAVHLDAYGKEDTPCPRCRRSLRKIVIAGRSTTYCPGCQR